MPNPSGNVDEATIKPLTTKVLLMSPLSLRYSFSVSVESVDRDHSIIYVENIPLSVVIDSVPMTFFVIPANEVTIQLAPTRRGKTKMDGGLEE